MFDQCGEISFRLEIRFNFLHKPMQTLKTLQLLFVADFRDVERIPQHIQRLVIGL